MFEVTKILPLGLHAHKSDILHHKYFRESSTCVPGSEVTPLLSPHFLLSRPKKMSTLQSYCSRISVGLPSYDRSEEKSCVFRPIPVDLAFVAVGSLLCLKRIGTD